MEDILFGLGIGFAVLAAIFLIISICLFFKFKVPLLFKEVNGTLEKEHIAEIRSKNSDAERKKGKVNVFEELEKNAKVKKNNTHSLNIRTGKTSTLKDLKNNDEGTVVLQNSMQNVNPDFVIEKNIMFVSTTEVI